MKKIMILLLATNVYAMKHPTQLCDVLLIQALSTEIGKYIDAPNWESDKTFLERAQNITQKSERDQTVHKEYKLKQTPNEPHDLLDILDNRSNQNIYIKLNKPNQKYYFEDKFSKFSLSPDQSKVIATGHAQWRSYNQPIYRDIITLVDLKKQTTILSTELCQPKTEIIAAAVTCKGNKYAYILQVGPTDTHDFAYSLQVKDVQTNTTQEYKLPYKSLLTHAALTFNKQETKLLIRLFKEKNKYMHIYVIDPCSIERFFQLYGVCKTLKSGTVTLSSSP
jgi:hypothetical protein